MVSLVMQRGAPGAKMWGSSPVALQDYRANKVQVFLVYEPQFCQVGW